MCYVPHPIPAFEGFRQPGRAGVEEVAQHEFAPRGCVDRLVKTDNIYASLVVGDNKADSRVSLIPGENFRKHSRTNEAEDEGCPLLHETAQRDARASAGG